MQSVMISILGTGSYLPHDEISSESIDKKLGLNNGQTKYLTGLDKRSYAHNERACVMGAKAARKALDSAGITIADIDCIIGACGTMEQAIPYNAALIHKQLNPPKPIPAFDINMTCLSHVMALEIAAGLFSVDRYKHILIVSSDIASAGLNWNDIHSAGIFGDGAAAVVLSKGDEHTGVLSSKFETYSEASDLCQIPGAGTGMPPSQFLNNYKDLCQFQMKGKELYRKVAKVLPAFIKQLLTDAELTIEDIDWVVPHQASALGISHIQKLLGLKKEKLVNIYQNHGNQIAASIPTALDNLFRHKPVKRGDLILIIGTSAGLSVGGMILRY